MRLQGKEVTVEIGMGEERIQSHGYQLQDLVDQTLAGARKLLPLERVNSNKGTDEEREERKRDIFSNANTSYIYFSFTKPFFVLFLIIFLFLIGESAN